MRVLLKEVRACYPRLYTPAVDRYNAEKSAYTLQVRMYDDAETTEQNVELVKKALKHDATEKWGAKAPAFLRGAMDSKNTRFLHRNEDEGYWYINLKRKDTEGAPRVVDRRKKDLIESDGKPLSGDYVNVVFDTWVYDTSGNRGFSATLMGVQWVSEGEPIGFSSKVEDSDFETYEEDSEDDDSYENFL